MASDQSHPATAAARTSTSEVADALRSDVQRLGVDGLSSFVGSSQPIARLVDLGLGEGLHHQEMADGVAGLAKLTMGSNHLRTLNHASQSSLLLGGEFGGDRAELVVDPSVRDACQASCLPP